MANGAGDDREEILAGENNDGDITLLPGDSVEETSESIPLSPSS